MLKAGIINPVESCWTSPVALSTKKDGIPRFCVKFLRLNSIVKRDRWRMPRVVEIFDEGKASTVFRTIHLFQWYWQMKMEEACKKNDLHIQISDLSV